MAEREEPPEASDPQEREDDAAGPHAEGSTPERIPPPDPEAAEQGKAFIVAQDAPLAVTIAEGQVADEYAPADLIVNFVQKVTKLLKDISGGVTPMFYGAAPQHSMTLLFGDAVPTGAQKQLPIEVVRTHALRVAELMELDGDALYDRALGVGPAVERYVELVQAVQSAGVKLGWQVRGEPVRELDVERAHAQQNRLRQEPPTVERPMVINGILYRVIAEPHGDDYRGTIGVRLHSWSTVPPGYGKGAKVIAPYRLPRVEDSIRAGLVNQPVEVVLLIRAAMPGTSFDPDRREIVVDSIRSGPAEHDRLGPPLVDDDESAGP